MTQETFLKLIGAETAKQMNIAHNRLYWPILTFIIFREKMDDVNYIVMGDFRKAAFSTSHTPGYLRMMITNEIPIISKIEGPYDKTKYTLTTYGRKLAMEAWNKLNPLMKREKKESFEEYITRMKKIKQAEFELKEDAKDTEEEMIKQIEEENERIRQENTRKAGVVKTENGNIIDLDKIQVGT